MEKLEKWEECVNNFQKKVNNFLVLNEWKFIQGIKEGEKIEIDDDKWEVKKQPISWSLNDGDAYFRKWIELPEEIEGIKIDGSKIYLRFVFPSGVKLYINGNEVYSHKFWADKVATPFLLKEKAKPKEKILIVFKTEKGDGLGVFWAFISIENIEDLLFELKSLLYQIKFAQFLNEELKNRKLKEKITKCIEILEPEIIEKREWNKFNEMRKNIEKLLLDFKPYAKKFKVHLIGHAHIDMNWLWTNEDTINVILRDFSTVNNLMKKYNDLTFSQSQTHVYKVVEEKDKFLFEKVREKVKEGRWDITASAWVENDLNMSDGESIVRHIIYSKKYIKEKFKKDVEIMWCPDTFGHPQTVPTIIKNGGINYYYFMRCGKGHQLFLWEGLDKSRVIAFSSLYNNFIDSSTIIPDFIKFYKKYRIKDYMFVYGIGNHGGGPTEEDIKRKIKLNEKPCFPLLEFSTTHKFFKIVEKYKNRFPIIKDELNFINEGCYTTHSDIKRANRECENILKKTEVLSSIGELYKIKYQEEKIEEMWRKTLFNQFHDIICGSAIHSSYEYSIKLADEVKEDGENIINEIVKRLKKENEYCISIFNPNGWEINNFFVIFNYEGEKDIHIEDENGEKINSQIFEGKIGFKVNYLPPFNFKSFYIKKGSLSSDGFIKNNQEYENNFYSIWIDKNRGLIRKIYDNKNKRDVIPQANSSPEEKSSFWAETCANLIKVYWEKPHPMSAWIIGNIYKIENLIDMKKMDIKEYKELVIFEVEREYENTNIIQRTILYKNLPFIDFEFETNWNIKGNKEVGIPLLRANFNFNIGKNEFYCEVPFGVIKRKNIPREYPALRWAGFKENNYWCVIMNKEKYGYYVNGNNLSLTLFRNPYEPDGNPDSGYHFISYRLFFGKSTITEITKMAMEYDNSPILFNGEVEKVDLFKIKGNIIPTSFKKSIDKNSYILRLVEYEGKKGKSTIFFEREIKNVWLSNIKEENLKKLVIKNKKLEFNFEPYQILTFKIEFK
jgi:alpha-mannosidase